MHRKQSTTVRARRLAADARRTSVQASAPPRDVREARRHRMNRRPCDSGVNHVAKYAPALTPRMTAIDGAEARGAVLARVQRDAGGECSPVRRRTGASSPAHVVAHEGPCRRSPQTPQVTASPSAPPTSPTSGGARRVVATPRRAATSRHLGRQRPGGPHHDRRADDRGAEAGGMIEDTANLGRQRCRAHRATIRPARKSAPQGERQQTGDVCSLRERSSPPRTSASRQPGVIEATSSLAHGSGALHRRRARDRAGASSQASPRLEPFRRSRCR